MSAVLSGTRLDGSTSAPAVSAPTSSTPIRPMVDVKLPTAAERLAASRVRLRAALMDIAHPPPRPSVFDSLHVGGLRDIAGPLLDKLKAIPAATFVVETIEAWWAQHPLRTASIIAGEASREFVLPIARQNPLALVVGSLVVGALLIASRPWRWLLRPALFMGLLPQLASQALKRMPIETWLGMLSSFKPKQRSAATASPYTGMPNTASIQDPSTP